LIHSFFLFGYLKIVRIDQNGTTGETLSHE